MPTPSTASKRLIPGFFFLFIACVMSACGGEVDKAAAAEEGNLSTPLAVAPMPDAAGGAAADPVQPGPDPAALPEAGSDEVIVDQETAAAVKPGTKPVAGRAEPMGRELRLSWTAPQTNDDGSSVTSLSGYRIYLGTSSGNYAQSVVVSPASVTSYLFSDLPPGTYYAVVKAYNGSGLEGAPSPEASKVIR